MIFGFILSGRILVRSLGRDGLRLGRPFFVVLLLQPLIRRFLDPTEGILEVLDRFPHGIAELGESLGTHEEENDAYDNQMLKRNAEHT